MAVNADTPSTLSGNFKVVYSGKKLKDATGPAPGGRFKKLANLFFSRKGNKKQQ